MISAFWSVINGTSQAGYWSLAILSGNRRRLQGRQIEMKTGRLEIGYDSELTQGVLRSGSQEPLSVDLAVIAHRLARVEFDAGKWQRLRTATAPRDELNDPVPKERFR